MQADFSEFSFGYAAIREAESDLNAVYLRNGAPILPSLPHEEALGWDVNLPCLGYALFLQFKRAEFISRRHPDSPTWGHVGSKHYRFSIDTDGHQHQRLLELEKRIISGSIVGDVYYVAPTFHGKNEFDDAYLTGQVLHRSVIEPPSEFGASDGIHHYVINAATGSTQVLSEPRRPSKRIQWANIVENTVGHARRSLDDVADRREGLLRLEAALLAVVEGLPAARGRDVEAPISRRIDRLAASLGCGLVLINTPSEN